MVSSNLTSHNDPMSAIQTQAADSKLRWYVMRAVSGKELKVKEYIDTEINRGDFAGHVAQVLVPMEKVETLRNGRRVVKDRIHLPGYVLVEAAFVGEVQSRLRNTPNVLGFLSDSKAGNGRPAPITEHEMNALLGRVDELEATPQEQEVSFLVGEAVKVSDGPFVGMEAVVDEINNEKKKLKRTVMIFGLSTALELGFAQVERM